MTVTVVAPGLGGSRAGGHISGGVLFLGGVLFWGIRVTRGVTFLGQSHLW